MPASLLMANLQATIKTRAPTTSGMMSVTARRPASNPRVPDSQAAASSTPPAANVIRAAPRMCTIVRAAAPPNGDGRDTLPGMCLLVFAWRVRPDRPLVLAGNRDEFHDRPAAPAERWPEPHGMVAGRDLRAGGTWLGVHQSGRIAVVTNYREPAAGTSGPRSRGELVVDFLTSAGSTESWIGRLDGRRHEYGGFNLVIGDGDRLHYLTNRGDDVRDLEPGVYGLSNHRLDTPWPKVTTARDRLRRCLEKPGLAVEPLFGLLADRDPAPDCELPNTGLPADWEKLLSSAFVVSPRYGTRASTVVVVADDGSVMLEERRFRPDGGLDGVNRFEL